MRRRAIGSRLEGDLMKKIRNLTGVAATVLAATGLITPAAQAATVGNLAVHATSSSARTLSVVELPCPDWPC